MCLFCELSLINKQLSNLAIKEFTTIGQKWGESQAAQTPGGTISYSFASENFDNQFIDFDSFITDLTFQREITNALSVWENIANIRFQHVDDSPTVDIKFGWVDLDGPGNVLGQTLIPASGPLDNVIVALDIGEDWFVLGDAPPDKIDFSSTVIHEIGHAIGIDHSTSSLALMNARYSTTIFNLQEDDISAATSIYGQNDVSTVEVYRFYNPISGGHFFTSDVFEKSVVEFNGGFKAEGIGFSAVAGVDESSNGAVPVYRFLNMDLGSHFFTAFEEEKLVVENFENFVFEGVGFKAFDVDTSATTPIFRFFNTKIGGHFFTASEIEKNAVMELPDLLFEGTAFYAFENLTI